MKINSKYLILKVFTKLSGATYSDTWRRLCQSWRLSWRLVHGYKLCCFDGLLFRACFTDVDAWKTAPFLLITTPCFNLYIFLNVRVWTKSVIRSQAQSPWDLVRNDCQHCMLYGVGPSHTLINECRLEQWLNMIHQLESYSQPILSTSVSQLLP